MAAAPKAALGLPRSRRLQQGRDFQQARAQGRRLAHGCLILNWLPLAAGDSSRLGVITGRKLGDAAVRSRARRLLREAFRLHQHELLEAVNIVLVARPSIIGKKFADAERDYLGALRRAGLLKVDAGSDEPTCHEESEVGRPTPEDAAGAQQNGES